MSASVASREAFYRESDELVGRNVPVDYLFNLPKIDLCLV